MKDLVSDGFAQVVKPYIDAQDKTTRKILAPVETDETDASRAYQIGDQLILGGILYDVIAPISQHGIITSTGSGANIEEADNITDQIDAVNSALTNELHDRFLLVGVSNVTASADGTKTVQTLLKELITNFVNYLSAHPNYAVRIVGISVNGVHGYPRGHEVGLYTSNSSIGTMSADLAQVTSEHYYINTFILDPNTLTTNRFYRCTDGTLSDLSADVGSGIYRIMFEVYQKTTI